MYYKNRLLKNMGHTQLGFIEETKCTRQINCTSDDRNRQTYYISNSDEVHFVVLGQESPETKAVGTDGLIAELFLRRIDHKEVLYLMQTGIILLCIIVAAVIGLQYLKPKEEEEGEGKEEHEAEKHDREGEDELLIKEE